MNLKHAIKAVTFGTMLGIAALSTSVALADETGMGPLSMEMKKMSNKEGMITKKNFMAMMERRFNAMDKAKKGMISTEDAMKIFRDAP